MCGSAAIRSRFGEERADFFIGGLIEIAVELAYSMEMRGRVEADDPVGFAGKLFAGAGGANGNGDDDGAGYRTRTRRAQSASRGLHRGAGGKAVVDKDDGAVCETDGLPAGAVGGFAALDLCAFSGGCGVDCVLRDPQSADDVGLQDDDAAARNGAHGELLLTGCAEFADDEDVKGKMELMGDFVRNRNAAAWESEDDSIPEVIGAKLIAEGLSEKVSCCAAIVKENGPEHGAPISMKASEKRAGEPAESGRR